MRIRDLGALLSLAPVCLAWGFGDDNPDSKWLPSPDGFVWPAVLEGAPRFEPMARQTAALPVELRDALAPHWPGTLVRGFGELLPGLPEQIRMAELDLNADGKDEVFLLVPIYGGSGGPHYEILTPDEKGLRRSGGVQGTFRFVQRRNGWLQIENKGRGGGGHYSRALHTFDGKAYRVTRNERHDFNAMTVTVRVPEAPNEGKDAAEE